MLLIDLGLSHSRIEDGYELGGIRFIWRTPFFKTLVSALSYLTDRLQIIPGT